MELLGHHDLFSECDHVRIGLDVLDVGEREVPVAGIEDLASEMRWDRRRVLHDAELLGVVHAILDLEPFGDDEDALRKSAAQLDRLDTISLGPSEHPLLLLLIPESS